jgi:hypothetical protein
MQDIATTTCEYSNPIDLGTGDYEYSESVCVHTYSTTTPQIVHIFGVELLYIFIGVIIMLLTIDNILHIFKR